MLHVAYLSGSCEEFTLLRSRNARLGESRFEREFRVVAVV